MNTARITSHPLLALVAAPALVPPVALVLGVIGWSLAGPAGAVAILGFLAGRLAERAERQLHAPEPLPQSVVSALCAGWMLWGVSQPL